MEEYSLYAEGNLGLMLQGVENSQWIKSNEIAFKVVEPNDDQKDSREYFRKALKAMDKQDYKLMESLLLKIINHYPNSIYLDKAVEKLSTLYRILLDQVAKGDSVHDNFIEKHPNSDMAYWWVPLKLDRIKSDEERKAYLMSITGKHDNSFRAKVANKYLKERFQKIK